MMIYSLTPTTETRLVRMMKSYTNPYKIFPGGIHPDCSCVPKRHECQTQPVYRT